MKIKDKTYDLKELSSTIDFSRNKLTKINDNVYLTNYQIDVLKRNGIDINNATSIKQIIFEASEIYEDTLDEELDEVIDQLCERNYYENTHK